MKIALFIDADYKKAGGVQEYVKGLYDYLNSKGHKVWIITPKSKDKIKDRRKIIEIGKSLPLKYPGTSASIALNWSDTVEIENLFNKYNFDIFHLMAPFGPLGLQLLDKSNARNVASFLIVIEKSIQPHVLKRILPLIKEPLKKLHGRLAISDIAKEFAESIYPGRYESIPLGIDIKRFKTNLPKLNKFKDTINILYVGRLDKRKGIKYLLKAYSELQKNTDNIQLLIVGKGPKEKKLKKFCKNKNIKGVKFLGFIPDKDIPRYYSSADIFCSPATENETFGAVILEAMASGLPVVAFGNIGYENVFGDLLKGFIVKNKSVDSLYQALKILIENESFRKSIGNQNRKIVEKMFSWEVVGKRIVEFYKNS